MPLFENFTIKSLCIHEIFQRVTPGVEIPPVLGTQPLTLDPQASSYMVERLVGSVSDEASGRLLVISEPETASFPDVHVCIEAFTNNTVLLQRSVEIAKRLSSAQTMTIIPGGMVLVIKGTVGAESCPYLCIIKAEKHSGFTKKIATNGMLTLEFAKELFLTPQQKLYKVGIFIKKSISEISCMPQGSPSTRLYHSFVFDSQMSDSNPSGAAGYFLKFLGCEIPQSNNIITHAFWDHTNKFISKSNLEEKDKYDLTYALYTYLKVRQSRTIQVSEFASQNMPPNIRDAYAAYMRDAGIPAYPIEKDLSLLRDSIEKRRLYFKSGIRLAGTQEAFDKKVKIQKQKKKNLVKVIVTDTISSRE